MTNDQMPRTFGDGVIHQSHFDVMVESNGFPLHLRHMAHMGETELKIGEIIAEHLVDDGATLQMGMVGYG